MSRTDGLGLGMIAAGSLFAYAGLTGRSIPAALQAIVKGKSPQTVAAGTSPFAAASSSPAGGKAGDVSAGSTEQSYFTAFLRDLSAPVTDANLQAMYRWAAKEEPSFPPPTSWTWNPLNIASPAGGFQSYASPQAGAFATAGFLLSNNYGAIVASLRTGNGITDSPAVAADLSRWSGGGYTSVNTGGG